MQPIENIEGKTGTKDENIIQSDDELRRSLSRLCYGDLYLIGKIWIEALQAVLVGARFNLVPTVHAAMWKEEDKTPKKPPPMKFKDLPIYDAPHYEYKDYLEDKYKCPKYKEKILHKALLPHVSEYRKKVNCYACQSYCALKKNYKNMCCCISGSKDQLKDYMRDPNNLTVRQGVLATGTLTGFLLGGGGGVPRRFFFTSLGALAAGSLCFPKETDETFREACYHTTKSLLAIYNSVCGKDVALRERVPCKEDMPKEPKPRKPLCPKY